MKIKVTRKHIKESDPMDIYRCACANAISERLGTQASVGVHSGHTYDPESGITDFTIDRKGQRFVLRNLLLPRWLQWPGTFEIELRQKDIENLESVLGVELRVKV